MKKIIGSIIIFLMSITLFFGQKGEVKTLISSGQINIKNIKPEDMLYAYDLLKSKTYYYILFKKNINTKEKPKYKLLDSIIIDKRKLLLDHYFTDTGEIKVENLTYQNLPAIVRKTKKYQGDLYKTIYKAWYYDIEHEMIKEIKLRNSKLRVYDQSHD